MNEPVWLSTEIMLAIQVELLARFGGLDGIRDEGLLESALNRPMQLFHYGEPTLLEMAAAYAHGIVKTIPSWMATSVRRPAPPYAHARQVKGFFGDWS